MNKYLKNLIVGLAVLAFGIGVAYLVSNMIIESGTYAKIKFALGIGGAFQLFIFISMIFPWRDMPSPGNARAMGQAVLTFNDPKKISEAAQPLRRYRGTNEGGGFVDNLPALAVGLMAGVIGFMM